MLELTIISNFLALQWLQIPVTGENGAALATTSKLTLYCMFFSSSPKYEPLGWLNVLYQYFQNLVYGPHANLVAVKARTELLLHE